MIGFAHKSISADNSSHFLLANKVTQFKIALTQYGIVQVKTWQEMTLKELAASRHHWITDQELISING